MNQTQFASFLQLLTKGNYTIEAIPSSKDERHYEITFDTTAHGPGGMAHPTQNPFLIDPKRVQNHI